MVFTVHNQIGFMAETFLNPYTTSILSQILEPQYNGSIGRAAAWADGYAHTDEGRFSYQWHWIDTHDYPPYHCALNYTGDCAKGGCVVSAIANQTGILRECVEDVKSGMLTGGTNLTCSYALKWVSHFLGDIAQPLHASGRAAGGNFYRVTFANVSTELHAVRSPSPPKQLHHTNTSPRFGTDTFPTSPPTFRSPSLTNPLTRSSLTSSRASAKINSTKHPTCGFPVLILQHLNSVRHDGRLRVISGHAIMYIRG